MSPDRPNHARTIERVLTDPRGLCEQLGLIGGPRTFLKQAGRGVIIRCPKHEEHTPSCSVRLGKDGTIAVKCFGCDWGATALGLIAAVRGKTTRGRDFVEVLAEGARLAGLWGLVDEIEGRASGEPRPEPARPPPTLPQAAPESPRSYPPDAPAFWASLAPISSDAAVADYLRGRAIDPEAVEERDLARVLRGTGPMPRWTACRGVENEPANWRSMGYRLILPVFDAGGELRSVRGWRVVAGAGPKRLPPTGHKASELVLADDVAIAWLTGELEPKRVVIAEGEPDFCCWSVRLNDPTTALLGIISGSWHKALADRFPVGCRVDVRVDGDAAGDRYAAEIESSLRKRCFVFRSKKQEAA